MNKKTSKNFHLLFKYTDTLIIPIASSSDSFDTF